MRIAAVALLLASPLAIAQARANDIETSSRIDAITVFPDGAMVTRLADVKVPPGSSSLLIRGLPAVMDPASVRVEAIANGALAIGSVETRLSPGEAEPAPDAGIAARIASLKNESDKIAARIDALEVKRKSIVRFSEADPAKLVKDDKSVHAATWKSTWDTVGDELARVNEDLRIARGKRTELMNEIAALEQVQPAQAAPRVPGRDVAVAIEAGSALNVSLTVVYRVSQAAWTSRYDARLDTGAKNRKPTLDLVRRAEITQSTGEDWKDVALTVSTVRTQGGTAAPEVTPMIVSLADIYAAPQPSSVHAKTVPRFAAAPAAAVPSLQYSADALVPPPQLAKAIVATLDSGAFQASFKVPGRVSVPRDGSPKTFTMSSATLVPELTALVSPSLDQAAYLDMSFVHNEDAPLLPGDVSIQRDGVFVGKGRFPLVAPGDKATLGVGGDDRIRVSRVPLRQKDNEPGFFNGTRSQITEFKTTVRNLHDTPIRVLLRDRMPVSDINLVSVEPLSTNTPATDKSVGEKRGVSAWSLDLAAGETRDIRFGWKLKWPAERDVLMHVEVN